VKAGEHVQASEVELSADGGNHFLSSYGCSHNPRPYLFSGINLEPWSAVRWW
jgi:hypothetical protein